MPLLSCAYPKLCLAQTSILTRAYRAAFAIGNRTQADMVKSFTHADETERRLVENMQKAGLTWSKIKEITGRSESTIGGILASPNNAEKAKTGQPEKLPPKAMEKVLKVMTGLQKAANANKEVTAAMILKAAGANVCDRKFREAFQQLGGGFHKLKEGPILDKQDYAQRKIWTGQKKGRTKKTWVGKPHAIIDNKKFRIYTTKAGRDHAARRSCRGAYQVKGQTPQPWLVKPKGGSIKFPAPGVQVTAAVINGKIRFWKYVEGNWNGARAAEMYKELDKALAKAFPQHATKPWASWSVIEDNDPTGYKSGKGLKAKSDLGIVTDDLPRRSPDLNVLDYSLWALINKKMREQEASFPKSFVETQEQFKARLRKTAMSLPTSLVKKRVGDMQRRCRLINEAGGGLIKE